MWNRYATWLGLSALLALGCGGNAVDLGTNGSRWADAATSPSDPTVPQTIYESAEGIFGFALDGPTLYALVNRGDTIELVACPLTHCRSQRTTLFSRPKTGNEGTESTPLVLAAGLLHWVDTAAAQRRVLACPTTGCSEPHVLTTDWSSGLAADDEGAYWVNFDRTLMRRAPGAEAPTVVCDLIQERELTSGLAARGDYVYFAASTNGSSSIRRVRKDGTSLPEAIATDQSISGFSFAADSLYYLSRVLTGRVAKCTLDGCATGGSTLAANQRWPGSIRLEGNDVFWLNNTQWSYTTAKATLVSCRLPDCATLETRLVEFSLAFGVAQDESFAVNQDSIIWLEAAHATGTSLRRLAR
jgi:hypothetical protein